MKPITPQECFEQMGSDIPEFVIEAVNNLLKTRYRSKRASFTQDEVITDIMRLNPTVSRRDIFDNHWLDFEPLYRRSGWEVEYDKPGYCETYDASWTFKKKERREEDL